MIVTLPWCAATISLTIARPSPAPPALRDRSASSRTNRSKTRYRSGAGMPGPSSSMCITACSPHARVSALTVDVACRAALSSRLRNIRDNATESPTSRVGVTIGPDLQRRFATQSFGLGRHQVVEVDVVACHRQPAFVGARQQQKILDQRLHPVRLGDQRGGRQLAVEQFGVGDGHLQRGDDRGERTAQFVRSISDESLSGRHDRLRCGPASRSWSPPKPISHPGFRARAPVPSGPTY